MRETIYLIAIGFALLIASAMLAQCTNNMRQEQCEKIGGEFYRALESANSMCKMPKK